MTRPGVVLVGIVAAVGLWAALPALVGLVPANAGFGVAVFVVLALWAGVMLAREIGRMGR